MLPCLHECLLIGEMSGALVAHGLKRAWDGLHVLEDRLWRDRMPVLGIALAIFIGVLIWIGRMPAVEGSCLIAGPLFSWIAERRRRSAAETNQDAEERTKQIAAIRGQSVGFDSGGGWGGSWGGPLLDRGKETLGKLFGEGKDGGPKA